jgi:hypothetical protein
LWPPHPSFSTPHPKLSRPKNHKPPPPPPPPPPSGAWIRHLPRWGVANLVRQKPKWVARVRGWGQIRHFSNNSTMKQYFKMLISHERHVFFALSLLQCQSSSISFRHAVKRENVAYIVKQSL